MGCEGVVIDEGLYTSDFYFSSVDEKMVKTGRELILVIESSKFGRRSFARFAPVTAAHIIITDDKIERKVSREPAESEYICIIR